VANGEVLKKAAKLLDAANQRKIPVNLNAIANHVKVRLCERVERPKTSATLDETQTRVENLTKNIANKNETAQKTVCRERVV
jgi:hypothetical protein